MLNVLANLLNIDSGYTIAALVLLLVIAIIAIFAIVNLIDYCTTDNKKAEEIRWYRPNKRGRKL